MMLLDDNFSSDHGHFTDFTGSGCVISYQNGNKVFDKLGGIPHYNTDGHVQIESINTHVGMSWEAEFSVDTNTVGSITDLNASYWQLGLNGNETLQNPLTGLVCNAGKFSYSEAGAGPQLVPEIQLKRIYRLTQTIEHNGFMTTYLRGPDFLPTTLIGVIEGNMTNRNLRMHFNLYSTNIVRLHHVKIWDLE